MASSIGLLYRVQVGFSDITISARVTMWQVTFYELSSSAVVFSSSTDELVNALETISDLIC